MELGYLQKCGWRLSYKVNQKNKNLILMHICGIQKKGIDDLICKAKTETHRITVWVPWEKGGNGMSWETHTHFSV